MRKKILKRCSSIILSFVMFLGFLPQAVYAQNIYDYAKNVSINLAQEPIITVETTDGAIHGNMPFYVFGTINYKSESLTPDLVVALDVYNKDTGEVIYELTGTDYPLTNTYKIGALSFPDYCESGVYVINVTLADGWNIIDSNYKEITYIK